MGDDLGEHVNSVKDGSNNDWDLLEDGVRSKKEGVLLGPLLNELLLLVELLKVLKINNININVGLGNLVLVLLISDNADLESGTGVVGKSDSSDETLVLLGIVVLKTNLEFDGFSELANLDLLSEFSDCFSNDGVVNLCGHATIIMIIMRKRELLSQLSSINISK